MSFSSYISLRKMPVGRHWFFLKQTRPRAVAEGITDAVAVIDEAIEEARSTQRAERLWAQAQSVTSIARGDAALIDNQIDEQIVAIFKSVESDTVGDDGDPTVEAAEEFISEIFHDGVTAITHRPFEVQLGIMDDMMERFENELSEHLVTLGITRHVQRLSRLIEKFRTELKEHEAGEEMTFDKLRAYRNDLHEATCKVAATILVALARYPLPIIANRADLHASDRRLLFPSAPTTVPLAPITSLLSLRKKALFLLRGHGCPRRQTLRCHCGPIANRDVFRPMCPMERRGRPRSFSISFYRSTWIIPVEAASSTLCV